MQYAISDVHGCFDEFQRLLDLVSPTSDDIVYVMGDMIDRGPKSAEMLVWSIDEAPDNFRFLLGNHEDMALCACGRMPGSVVLVSEEGIDPWCFNGGAQTTRELIEITDYDWRREVMVPWLQALSPYTVVQVDGRPIMLVHAGFNPQGFDDEAGHTFSDFNDDPLAHHAVIDVGHGFGRQSEQHMLWAREGWYADEEPSPTETVFGHTPKPLLVRDAYRKREYFGEYPQYYEGKDLTSAWFQTVDDNLGTCWHYLNRHDIDCGCAYGGRLCCLRLDDFEEFYVDGPAR